MQTNSKGTWGHATVVFTLAHFNTYLGIASKTIIRLLSKYRQRGSSESELICLCKSAINGASLSRGTPTVVSFQVSAIVFPLARSRPANIRFTNFLCPFRLGLQKYASSGFPGPFCARTSFNPLLTYAAIYFKFTGPIGSRRRRV